MTTLDYLIPELRFVIGDTNVTTQRYLDEWLLVALAFAVKKFQRYYRPPKYLINSANEVTRNELSTRFTTVEADEGTIEKMDEPILVTLAAILTLEGSLEQASWNSGSWRDAEISFSNIESGRLKDSNIKRLREELNELILSPTKRLASTDKQSLPGFKDNEYEREGDL